MESTIRVVGLWSLIIVLFMINTLFMGRFLKMTPKFKQNIYTEPMDDTEKILTKLETIMVISNLPVAYVLENFVDRMFKKNKISQIKSVPIVDKNGQQYYISKEANRVSQILETDENNWNEVLEVIFSNFKWMLGKQRYEKMIWTTTDTLRKLSEDLESRNENQYSLLEVIYFVAVSRQVFGKTNPITFRKFCKEFTSTTTQTTIQTMLKNLYEYETGSWKNDWKKITNTKYVSSKSVNILENWMLFEHLLYHTYNSQNLNIITLILYYAQM